jgi:structural maintenance of chromosomes protein 5
VKHGCREAETEIELAAAPHMAKNPIIRRIIKREGNKHQFFINGRQVTHKEVQNLAKSFSIQLDNLCTFMPQDRVAAFARLDPVDMLKETQRAAAPEHMVTSHEKLKELARKQKGIGDEKKSEERRLGQLEERQKSAKEDVDRWKQRQEHLANIALLKKARPVIEFNLSKKTAREAKQRRRKFESELYQLRREVAPSMQAIDLKTEYRDRVKQVLDARKPLVDQAETRASDIWNKITQEQAKVKASETQAQAEVDEDKERRKEVKRIEAAIACLKRQMESAPINFDPRQYNTQMHDLRRKIKEKNEALETIKTQKAELHDKHKDVETDLKKKQQERNQLDTQSGARESKLRSASTDAYSAWQWVQQNQSKFQDEVCGPPLVTCSIPDQRFAAAVEARLNFNDVTAITCKSPQDAKMLQAQVFGEMKLHNLSVRTAPKSLSWFKKPVENPQQYGLDGWLLDYIKGPELVLSMLCDSARLHQTGVTLNKDSDAHFQVLQESPITSWVAGGQFYSIMRRKEYSALSTSVRLIQKAKWFETQGVDTGEKSALEATIKEKELEQKGLSEGISGLELQAKELQTEIDALRVELVTINLVVLSWCTANHTSRERSKTKRTGVKKLLMSLMPFRVD